MSARRTGSSRRRSTAIAALGVMTLLLAGLDSEVVAQGAPSPGCPAEPGSGMCSITADISPEIGGGGIGVGGFTPNSGVRYEIFQSPGGARLFGPVTKPTDATGSEALSFDALAAGHHVVVTDLATSTVKDIVVSDATVEEVEVATDLVSGTATPGTNITVMAFGYGHSFSSPSTAAEADELGNWSADFAALGVDVTNRTGIAAIVTDGDGDSTRTGPRPGCPAVHPGQTCRLDVAADGGGGDQITVIGFSPLATVRIEVFDAVGGELVYGPFERQTGSTGFQGHHSARDLTEGDHVVVTDLATGVVKDLEVAPLAITAFDPVADTVTGTASPGEEVFAGLFGSPVVLAVANEQGVWNAQFSGDQASGQDVTVQSNPNAMVFDDDEDATRASPAPGCPGVGFVCVVGSSLEHDSVLAFGFEPNSEVVFNILDSAGGQPLVDPITRPTSVHGDAAIDFGFNPGPDLQPGMQVTVTDVSSGILKSLVLSDVVIDLVDPATDVVEGHAPAGSLVGVEASGAPRHLDVMADDSGFWHADFGALGYDIDSVSWFLANVGDDDGDFTNDALGSPIAGCIDDADTACGSAAPDTIREDDGEVIAGLEADTALVTLDEGSSDVEVEGGPGSDDTVIDPGESRAARFSSFVTFATEVLPIRVDGGKGSDRLVLPTSAADLLVDFVGGGGDDVVRLRDFGDLLATIGHFELSGGAGRDDLSGADGADLLVGGIGDDLLAGLAALDRLVGGPGDDRLLGGKGSDVLKGGDGFDRMKGGGGRDTCVFDSLEEKQAATSCEVLRPA